MDYLKGPWRCSDCGKIYESLDMPGTGEGIPGCEPVYICQECTSKNLTFPGDDCWE